MNNLEPTSPYDPNSQLSAGKSMEADKKNRLEEANTLLMAAVEQHDLEKISEALKAGADIDCQKDGITPLIAACMAMEPNPEIVSKLLSYDAHILIKDHTDRTAMMHLAANYNAQANSRGNPNREKVETIILHILKKVTAKHNLNFWGKDGASSTDIQNNIRILWGEVVNWIISKGCCSSDYPETIGFGWPEMVQVLLLSGFDLKTPFQDMGSLNERYNGYSFLHYFAERSPNPEGLRTLLDIGCDVNSATQMFRFTPLTGAAARGNIENVKVLLEYGAKVELVDARGMTARDCAAANNHYAVVKFLSEYQGIAITKPFYKKIGLYEDGYKCKMNILHLAARCPEIDIKEIEGYQKAGVDIDAKDDDGNTPLTLAVTYGHLTTAEAILKRKASAWLPNGKGITAFAIAAKDCNMLMLKLLKKYHSPGDDADLLYLSKPGDRSGLFDLGDDAALANAASAGRADIFELLYNRHEKHKITLTALCAAARSGHTTFIKNFLDTHAEDVPNVIHLKDARGFTPVMEAAALGNIEMIKDLLEAKFSLNAISLAGDSA